jgi:aspartate/tyrosine/aromatic aminotransferase
MIDNNMDKEYAGITGVPSFTKAACALAYGDDSAPIAENRVCFKKKEEKKTFFYLRFLKKI